MTLKEKLLAFDLVEPNEFLEKYINLIENNRGTRKIRFKTQKHHVIPKYYFKENKLELDNSSDNVVNLYYKDHILAHYYLCLCSKTDKQRYQNFISLRHVYNNFWIDSTEDDLRKLDKYQELYEQSKKYQSEFEQGRTLKPATQERKDKISNANKGRQYVYFNDELKFVKQNELEHYLSHGWKLGNPKVSKAKLGKAPSNKGKPSPRKGIPRPKWLCEMLRHTNKRARPVYCFELCILFDSLSEASRQVDISTKLIRKSCNNFEKSNIKFNIGKLSFKWGDVTTMTRTTMKDFYGRIIGSTEDYTDRIVSKDFYGKILGYYDKKQGVTKDFFGKIIGTGDATSKLVWDAWREREERLKNGQ